MNYRIGFGYDVHQLDYGYNLIIGGVHISHDKGCVAHSDGDVLIHSICDALLGAVGLGDIGTHFPDNDPEYENIHSTILLTRVMDMIQKEKFQVVNIDTTICLQEPKLSSSIPEMREVLKSLLGTKNVSIKATTTEKLGAIGEGKGISAYAIAMVEMNK